MKATANQSPLTSLDNQHKPTTLRQVTRAAAIAIAVAASSMATAAAPDTGWYGNINLGRGTLSSDTDSFLTQQGVTGTSTTDKHDTAFGLGVGYQFNRNFALEGNYIDFGRYDVSSTIGAPAADTAHGRYRVDGWNVGGVGLIPLDNGFSVYGKAGVIFADTKLDLSSDTGTVPVSGGSKSSTNGTYGLGASYDFTDRLIGKMEWNRYHDLGDSETSGKIDLDTYTMGVSYRF